MIVPKVRSFVRVIDTEEAESTERISHRDTENLCVSVSPWLILFSVRSWRLCERAEKQ